MVGEAAGGELVRWRTSSQMTTAARVQPARSDPKAKRTGGVDGLDAVAKNQELRGKGQAPF